MRTALVPVSAGTTTQVVAQSECPANIAFSNAGAGPGANGTVYFSNEGNAFDVSSGVPVVMNDVMVWGKTDRPLFAYCISEPTEILVTFLDKDDEITV